MAATCTANSPYLTAINRNFNPPTIYLMHPALKDMPTTEEKLPLDRLVPYSSLKRRGGISSSSSDATEIIIPDLDSARMKRRGAISYSDDDESATYIRNLGKAICCSYTNAVTTVADAQAKRASIEAKKQSKNKKETKVTTTTTSDSEEDDECTIMSSRTQVRRGSSQYHAAYSSWNQHRKSFDKSAIDINYDKLQEILKTIDSWDFDIFSLANLTGGRPLVYLGLHLFEKHNLIEKFDLNREKLTTFLTKIEDSYHPDNSYHNAIHAADVAQAVHCLITDPKLYNSLTDIDIISVILAAICHDTDHPGVNQAFLVNSNSYLATVHGRESVLERHHLYITKVILAESGLLDHLSVKKDILILMEDLILATDVTRHKDFLTKFQQMTSSNTIDLSNVVVRSFVLTIAIKTADISNPARSLHLSQQWSYLIMEEFFQQGDLEKESNLSLSFLCDRNTTHIPKSQASFFELCALPLFKAWDTYFQSSLSASMCINTLNNKEFWSSIDHLPNDQLPRPLSLDSHNTTLSSSQSTNTLVSSEKETFEHIDENKMETS